jgi:hypothetical protein
MMSSDINICHKLRGAGNMEVNTGKTPWETIELAVKRACAQSDFASAETILRFAVRESEHAEALDRRLVSMLIRLADAHVQEQRFEAARRIYALGLDLNAMLLEPNHPEITESLDRLSTIVEQVESATRRATRPRALKAIALS